MSEKPRKLRTTAQIVTPLKGRIGLGQPVRIVCGGGLSRAHLSGDLFNERPNTKCGLVTQPQKEGPPLPWLLLSAVWGNPDDHDTLYAALDEGENPQWLASPRGYATRGTLYFSFLTEHMKQLEVTLHQHPVSDDSGVFKLLLPRRLPTWLYLYPSAAQCFLPL